MLRLRWWLVLLIILIQRKGISCVVKVPRGYSLLFNGGQKVNAAYNTYPGMQSRAMCAASCSQTSGCWLFMWDLSSMNCHLLKELTTSITLMAAGPTFQTFYVSAINGRNIFMTPKAGTWTASKTACENMGGRLFVPEDTTYSIILHYLHKQTKLWTGMHRDPSVTTVWYNIEGKVDFLKPTWYPNEPNNANGIEYYVGSLQGYIFDVGNGDSFFGVCEV